MSTSILLIDLSSIAHAAFHMSGSEPNPDWTSQQTVARVRALASGQPHVAICIDSPPYFRKTIDTTYKSNRPTEHQAVIGHQIATAIDVLKTDGFPVWGAAGYEADDIIATAAKLAETKEQFHYEERLGVDRTVIIASADKDVLQLVNDRVSIKSLKDGSTVDADAVKAKFGVWPHQIVDYLALVGDKSDNIEGAKGIGAKRAAEILELFGNLDDTYRAVHEGNGANSLGLSMGRSLLEFEPRLNTVRDLIRLRTDAPIPFDEIFKERVPQDVAIFGGEEMPDVSGSILDGPGPPVEGVAKEETHAAEAARTAEVLGAMSREGEHVPNIQPLNASKPIARVPEVVNHAPVDWNQQLEPRSMHEAKQIAADLFASRMFSNYGNAPAVLSTIMAGRELGFQTIASLRAFHIIEGKPAMAAGAIHALILKSGKAEYFRCAERTAERATFVTKRKGEPEIALSFTIEEARIAWPNKRDEKGEPDAKSWAASGWGKNPADMCVARALSKLARLVYPDVTHGLYAPEEF